MATPANGGASKRGIQGRIAGVRAGLLLLVVLVVAAWHSGGSRLHEGDASAPWIGLPPGGTDLADWSTRRILQQLHDEAGPRATLVDECGHDPATRGETYIATLADARARTAGASCWKSTAMKSRPARPRPLARPSCGNCGANNWSKCATLGACIRRGPKQPACRRWPVTSTPTRLEACIDGRYAIRQPAQSEMSARLHAALVSALSLPPAGTSPR